MLDAHDIHRVRESFEFLLPLQEDAAEAFYSALFERHPAVRPLFPEEMQEQTGKLWSVLVTVTQALEQLHELAPLLREMGARHVAYGVSPAHYPAVAETLIDTIALAMGPEFTPSHRLSWEKTLSLIADEMLAGAEKAA